MLLNKVRSVIIQCERKDKTESKTYCFALISRTICSVFRNVYTFTSYFTRGRLKGLWVSSLITVVSQFGTGSSLPDEAVSSEISLHLICMCALHCVQPFWWEHMVSFVNWAFCYAVSAKLLLIYIQMFVILWQPGL